jgi:hypothetical protein
MTRSIIRVERDSGALAPRERDAGRAAHGANCETLGEPAPTTKLVAELNAELGGRSSPWSCALLRPAAVGRVFGEWGYFAELAPTFVLVHRARAHALSSAAASDSRKRERSLLRRVAVAWDQGFVTRRIGGRAVWSRCGNALIKEFRS